jgi:hypothetical protein
MIILQGCSRASFEASVECESRLMAIKNAPLKRQVGLDLNYDFFEQNNTNKNVQDCLITNINNETAMDDPGSGPLSYNFKVGDMSLFVLSDFYGLKMTEVFPNELRERFETTGMSAYFEYVRDEKNGRQRIQENVRAYYAKESD